MRARSPAPSSLLTLGLAVSACTGAERPVVRPERPAATRPSAVAHPAPPAEAARVDPCPGPPLEALQRDDVDSQRPPPATLYTWTTAEQADGLRRGGALLTRAQSPTRGPSVYDRALAMYAERGHPGVRTLRDARFRRARFAWATPWPTLRGWDGEAYGDRLVRVTLRPEAWVLELHARVGLLRARSLDGAEVPVEQVVAHPERVGAVYFLQDATPALGTMLGFEIVSQGMFREFVLPNEGMVASWELDTPAAHAALDDATAMLAALRAHIAHCPVEPVDYRINAMIWSRDDGHPPLTAAWARALAITSDRYALTTATLDAILAALRAVPRGAPFRADNRPGARRPVLDPQANDVAPTRDRP